MLCSLSPQTTLRNSRLLLLAPCLVGLLAPLVPLTGQTLTVAEADRIIAEEMAAIEARKAVKPEFTIVETHENVIGNEGVIFHKVLPPVRNEAAPVSVTEEPEIDEALVLEFLKDSREHRSLSLGIQIYDDEMSELIWRKDGRIIRVFSNINFAYLTPLGEFEGDGVVYSIFALVTRTTRERELQRLKAMKEAGIEVAEFSVPELADFSGPDPEYLVYSDSKEPVPDELFEALDALHLYYAEHEAELKDSALKRESLAAARERYEKANPKPKKPLVIHYWKGEGNSKETKK